MLHQRPKDLTATKARAVIPRDALKRAAMLLQAVIERRKTIPILSYIKVQIAPNSVTLSGTDMDNMLTVKLEAETEGTATVMVASAVLAGFAPIAAGAVTLTLSGRDAQAMDVIQLSDGETAISVNDHMPVADFPEVQPRPHDALRPAVTLTQDQTARLIRLSRHCISNEETRYYLHGVWLTTKPEGKTLRAVTTDGHRMAVIDHDAEADFSATRDKGLIVHAKTIDLLRLIIGKGGNEPVQFDCGQTFLSVKVGGCTLHAKTIDGTFPDYMRVIPPPSGNLVAHLSGSALQRMWHAARAMTANRSTAAELNFTVGRIGFQSPSFNDASFSMPLQAKRAEGCTTEALGFSLNYLRDQGAITPTFTINSAGQGDPATIHSDDPDALWILMPMRL